MNNGFCTMLDNVRQHSPLIHNITNYVTVNDVANVLLAIGASPIMSDDIGEVSEITTICSGLCINIGTLNHITIPSMKEAAGTAARLGHPLLLDPVGAGASRLRTKTAEELLRTAHFTAVRGNISEIRAVFAGQNGTRGVDAAAVDAVTDENLPKAEAFAMECAKRSGCIIAVTGAIDLVADPAACYVIRNGRPEMSRITGTGCQLSALMTAFLAANPTQMLSAAAAAVSLMGLAGETAWARMQPGDGNSTYRNRIIDAVCHMTGADLEKGAKYEIHTR